MSWETEEYDVIIVGSGMAGLGASRVLLNEGVKFLVLEGRDRPGGRVFTDTLPAIENLPKMDVDLGANYLIGCSYKHSEQPLLGLTKEANVETVTCAGDLIRKYGGWECPEIGCWKNYKTGEDIPMDLVVSMSHLYDITISLMTMKYYKLTEANKARWRTKNVFDKCLKDILNLYYANGLRSSPLLSDLEAGVFEALSSRLLTYQSPMDQLSVDIFHDIAISNNHDTDVFKVRPLTEHDISEWIRMINLRLDIIHDHPPSVTTKVLNNHEDKLVTNRFSNFVDLLKGDIPILYRSIVKSIDYRQTNEIVVTCVNSDTHKVHLYKCRHCIITVPVGVLAELSKKAAITFLPPLPQYKIDAIKRLALPHAGAETHNKIVLRYRPEDVFWDMKYPHLKTNSGRLHILNFHCYGKPGLLVCHIWGGTGIKTIDHTDEELVNMMLEMLEGMYQKRAPLPKPIQTLVTRWSEDPFSLGSYTPGGQHSCNEDRQIYARPVPEIETPSLLFAGEGTLGDLEAKECTHGALMSGVQRAAEIVNTYFPRRKLALGKPSLYLKRKLRYSRNSTPEKKVPRQTI